MPPKSNVPIRICGSKTRSGCKTCKQRHLKCDEAKPICVRCSKAGRECIYDRVQSLSTTPPRSQADEDQLIPANTSRPQLRGRSGSDGLDLLLNVTPYGSHDPSEISAARHFATYLSKDLAGCFSDEVWSDILPRVAQHEPTIWHALVAVGILDDSLRSGHCLGDDNPEVSAAVQHYSKSIRKLSERLESPLSTYCKDVVLLSCILFAVFECLQNHHQSALRHITGGTKLLMAWEDEARSHHQAGAGIYLNYRSLQPVFLALDSQAVQLGAADFKDHYALPAIENGLQIPRQFASIQLAHVALNFIFNRLARWAGCNECAMGCDRVGDDRAEDSEEGEIRAQLLAWDLAFETLSRTTYSQPATRMLILQKKILQIFLGKGALGPSEMGWDIYNQEFAEAATCAEAYMDLAVNEWRSWTPEPKSTSRRTSNSKPALTLAMDIVMSLYLIAVKCRKSSIRMRALKMLKACQRKEGIWDSVGCSAVAEEIIDIEQEQALVNGTIPEDARVYMLDIRFGEDQVSQIMYKKLVPDPGRSGYIEVIVQR